MIRGGGGVALCNSLSRNSSIAELNLAWNGLAWEGSLSLSEALRVSHITWFPSLRFAYRTRQ